MRSVSATAKASRSRAQTGRRAAPPVARTAATKRKAARQDEGAPLWLRILKSPLKLAGIRRPVLVATLILAALTVIAALIASGAVRRSVDAVEDGLGALATDAGFGIANVHLIGAERTSPQTVLSTLGFHLGQSIFGADVHAARERLLSLDWIKTAEVRRRYPDDITVTVTEKKPFALWRDAAGQIWVIERDGSLITREGYREFLNLPRFVGTGAPENAAAIVDALPGHRAVVARLEGMQRVGERRWNLVLDDGVVVQLPETGWKKELDTLEHLIVDKGILERDVTQIDLRSPTTYFFLLKSGNKQQVERGKSA
ncbi:MAG TPA: FtsQ-type POTRA domain-containing protein [Rhizomicrobium sp.]|nr:FtsQ-type POTRA domain-containing protein [Rhizomicrobium sp.]